MAQQGVKKIGRLPIEDMTDLKISSEKLKTMKIIGELSMNHFIQGFRQGGGQTDASKSGWKERSSRDSGREILVLRGHLRDDIEVIKVTESLIIIGTQKIPYASRHNEGLKGMVKREFMGASKDLEIKNEEELVALMDMLTKGRKI